MATTEITGLNAGSAALSKRWLLFACWIVVSSLFFTKPLIALVRLALSQDNSSYLALIPLISGWVLFVERRRIFLNVSFDRILGGALLALAGCAVLAALAARGASSPDLQLSGYLLALVLFWIAGFGFLFGGTASKAGSFPLLFLFLMVPIPNFLLDRIIYLLQVGSAGITEFFFNLFGVPVLRDGLVFHLAPVSIEVSQECSGIRSSMALLILALLVAHFYLRSLWKKVLFVAFGLFVMILKNGIRIVTLTMLAMYVDPGFLYGRLHHEGGVVFFLIGLLVLWPLLKLLQRGEAWPSRNVPVPSGPSASGSPTV